CNSTFSSTSEPFLRPYADVPPVCRRQDKDTFHVDDRITLVQALANLEGGPKPRSPVGIEDQLPPVQSWPNQEDGRRKGRQCQETASVPFYI
ncbi:hypothetical protein ARMGADRAFT_1160780, partial [Armillaria gallica]